jgi:uncharacterized protein YecE (DUF72 family)
LRKAYCISITLLYSTKFIKIGPLLFQFGYFNKTAFKPGKEFLARLAPFLKKLPKGHRFALEIRNKQLLTAEFFDLLREHKIVYALIDQAWMPPNRDIREVRSHHRRLHLHSAVG